MLVLGGSRGARGVNNTVTKAMNIMGGEGRELSILHQAGREDCRDVAAAYDAMGVTADVREFIEDMGEHYDWADVVVSRAGAGAVSEIAANGRPALFIPYPHAAGGHQHRNARWLVDRGGAQLIDERERCAAANLAEALRRLKGDRNVIREMARKSRQAGRRDAARLIVDECVELLNKRGR